MSKTEIKIFASKSPLHSVYLVPFCGTVILPVDQDRNLDSTTALPYPCHIKSATESSWFYMSISSSLVLPLPSKLQLLLSLVIICLILTPKFDLLGFHCLQDTVFNMTYAFFTFMTQINCAGSFITNPFLTGYISALLNYLHLPLCFWACLSVLPRMVFLPLLHLVSWYNSSMTSSEPCWMY